MQCYCCGRGNSWPGKEGLGICANCEFSLTRKKWKRNHHVTGVHNVPDEVDVTEELIRQLKVMSDRLRKGDSTQLCEAMVGRDQCQNFSKYDRDNHAVCKIHLTTKKNIYGDDPICGFTFPQVKMLAELLAGDATLRAEAESYGIIYNDR